MNILRYFIRELIIETYNKIDLNFLLSFAKNAGILDVNPQNGALSKSYGEQFSDLQIQAEWIFHELGHLVLAGLDFKDVKLGSTTLDIDKKIKSFKNHELSDEQEIDASAIAFNIGKLLSIWGNEARLPIMKGSKTNMSLVGQLDVTDEKLLKSSQTPFAVNQAKDIIFWLRGFEA